MTADQTPVAGGGVDRGALARAVAAATAGTPGVAGLVPGPGVPVATHYPGGVVVGVRLAAEMVSVHVCADRAPLGPVAGAVAEAVGAALSVAGDARPVRVVVEDLDEAALLGAARQIGGR